MASITATPLPALGIVKLFIDWAPSQQSDLVRVYRITPDGGEVEVIGSPVRLSGGQAIVYDTTAPFDVALSYRATITNPLVSSDDFARMVVPGWGSDEMGNAYTTSGGTPGDYSTNGQNAVMQMGTVDAARNVLLPMTLTDSLIEASVSPPTQALGAEILMTVGGRWVDSSNFYHLRLRYLIGGVVQMDVVRRLAGVDTILAIVTVPGGYTAFTWHRVELEIIGTRLRARAWTGTSTKPNWQIEVYDSTFTSGRPFYRGLLAAGNTNALPVTLSYELTRVTSFTASTLTTVGTVELDADPHGWVRDPQEPARSVRLDNCGTHTFNCLTADRFVFFQGLEEESYESATGVFSVLDAENPLTVAQTRKGISTGIRFVSTSLSDIPPLRRLFSSGRDLALSLPMQYGWGIETYGTDPVTFHDVTASRLNRRDMRKPQRLWSAPMRVVDADTTFPTGRAGSNAIPVPGATYGDMKALSITYGQLRGSTIADTFNRTVAPGSWGTASAGPAWAITTGPAAQNQVAGGVGQMAMTDRAGPDLGTRTLIELPIAHTDVDVRIRFRWGIVAAGDFQRASLVVRKNGTFYIVVEATFAVGGAASMRVGQRTGGASTPYGASSPVAAVTQTAWTWYWLRAQVIGTTVRGRLWQDGSAEPGTWHITATTGIASGTSVGVEGFASGFSTNPTPEILEWDDLALALPGVAGMRSYLEWSQGVFV